MITVKQADKKAQLLKLQAIRKKIKKGGIYEDFGQDEARELRSYIGTDFYAADQGIRDVIDEFMFWVENYALAY